MTLLSDPVSDLDLLDLPHHLRRRRHHHADCGGCLSQESMLRGTLHLKSCEFTL